MAEGQSYAVREALQHTRAAVGAMTPREERIAEIAARAGIRWASMDLLLCARRHHEGAPPISMSEPEASDG